MLFNYKALKDSKVVKGTFDGTDTEEVLLYLKSNNFIPIEVKKGQASSLGFLELFNGVGFQDISNFTRQMAMMLNAGLTLVDSIEILKKQTTKVGLIKLLEDINREIRSGKSYSQTLEKYPQYFPHLYIALVKAGEASGKLDTIMLKIADNMETQKAFRAKVTGALIYPGIISLAGLVLIFIMITFVLPGLTEVYKNFSVELPASTQFIIKLSDFLNQYWYYVVGAALAVGYLLRKLIISKQGKQIKDTLMVNMPLISELVKMTNLVDATRTFAILIGSGVSILESLAITSEATDNIVFQEGLRNVYRQVEKGVNLGDALSHEKVFPITLVQMSIVGEQTGKLEETLTKISEYYQVESETALKAFTTLIEPTVLVVLGVAVGFLVMSIITPIYSLTQSFNQ